MSFHVSGVLEKLCRILNNHDLPVYFKSMATLREILVHPKYKNPREKHSSPVQ